MFPTTRWSVLVAGREDPEQARCALEYLCQAYRRPVLAYVRRRVASRADAEDLTQSFFAALIERRIDSRADPLRGRFRALLLTALKNFLASAETRRCAAVRGGGIEHADLDAATDTEAAHGENPEDVFLSHWALAVLERAMQRMRDEAVRAEYFPRAASFHRVDRRHPLASDSRENVRVALKRPARVPRSRSCPTVRG